MRIACVISSLSPGGAERVMSGLANYWAQKHDVTLITLDSRQSIPFYPLSKNIQLIQTNQKSQAQSYTGRFFEIIKRLFVLRQAIKSAHPDILLSFVDITNLTTLLGCMRLNVPVVVSERIDPHHHPIPKLYQWLRRKLYSRAKNIIVQTQSAADYFNRKLQGKITIIPNIVNEATSHVSISNKVSTVISVGRLEKQKDFGTLIHAFSNALQTYPDLKLVIYGEGSERTNLEKLIASLYLTGKVFLPGVTPSISAELLKADLFVFPSRYEGFPNALCEAMAAGLPVIASSCSGNIDVVRDEIDGRLFPVGDVNVLTTLLVELVADDKQRQNLSNAARDIPQRFNRKAILKMWDQALGIKTL